MVKNQNSAMHQTRKIKTISRTTRISIVFVSCIFLAGCPVNNQLSAIDAIKNSGEIRFAMLQKQNIANNGSEGLAGVELDLSMAFAEWLDVSPNFQMAPDEKTLISLLEGNQIHVGAALLPISDNPTPSIAFGPSFAVSRYFVIHHRSRRSPKTKEELEEWTGVMKEDTELRRLINIQFPKNTGFRLDTRADATLFPILKKLEAHTYDYAVVHSFDFAKWRRVFPDLVVGLELDPPQPVSWLFRNSKDRSVWNTQIDFLREIRSSGKLERILERHFGKQSDYENFEHRTLIKRYRKRFPKYRAAFKAESRRYGFDWRLLAAVSYQESHWQADARSKTGVRGIMMLTKRTAEELGVNRLDPNQAIKGGTRYLAQLRDRLPKRLIEQDRLSMALAAYNVGLRNLENARVLTQKAGRNPDHWDDVQEFLPLLASATDSNDTGQKRADGRQAVQFVSNIKMYYDVLCRIEPELPQNYVSERKINTPDGRLISPVF